MDSDKKDTPHKPRNRSGGVFMKPEEVNLHANDFDFDEKVKLLSEAEEKLIEQYTSICTKQLNTINTDYSGEQGDDSWEGHYSTSRNHFPLKNYIYHAFPVLKKYFSDIDGASCIMECGCGTGSTLLPLLHNFGCNHSLVVGFDVSRNALKYFSDHPVAQPLVAEKRLVLFEYDIARDMEIEKDPECKKRKIEKPSPSLTLRSYLDNHGDELKNKEADIMLLIFVLSALPSVNAMYLALRRLWNVMKPGALLLFRDYGMADHNFFRFIARDQGKLANCDICFTKGDQTTQVFFEKNFTVELFEKCGFEVVPDHIVYHCNRIHNRKNGKSMDKIFINAIFKKK